MCRHMFELPVVSKAISTHWQVYIQYLRTCKVWPSYCKQLQRLWKCLSTFVVTLLHIFSLTLMPSLSLTCTLVIFDFSRFTRRQHQSCSCIIQRTAAVLQTTPLCKSAEKHKLLITSNHDPSSYWSYRETVSHVFTLPLFVFLFIFVVVVITSSWEESYHAHHILSFCLETQ